MMPNQMEQPKIKEERQPNSRELGNVQQNILGICFRGYFFVFIFNMAIPYLEIFVEKKISGEFPQK